MDPSHSSYGNNCTVGCLVYLDDKSAFETWDGVMVTASVMFNVDGNLPSYLPPPFGSPVGTGYSSNMFMGREDSGVVDSPITPFHLYVPMEEDLYPTLTLHSSNTQVMCRFCAEDILANSRDSIGAPEGVAIYAVDGSVLFESNDYIID